MLKKTHCKRGHPFTPENTFLRKDGYKRCLQCRKEWEKSYQKSHREQLNSNSRKWRKNNLEYARRLGRIHDHKRQPERNTYQKDIWYPKYRKQLRIEALTYYGNGKLECICCHEKEVDFLTLDHINGNGKQEREKNHRRSGWMLLQYLRYRNYPEGYQTLCWNCNCARSFNKGVCPHKRDALQIQG